MTPCCCGERVTCWYGGEADIATPPLTLSTTFLGVTLPTGTPYAGVPNCAGAIGQTCKHGIDQSVTISTDRFPCFGGQFWFEPLSCTAYIPSAGYLTLNCNSSISEGVLPYSVNTGELPDLSVTSTMSLCPQNCGYGTLPCFQSGGVMNSRTCNSCFETYNTTGVPDCQPTTNNASAGIYIGAQSAYPCWERIIKDVTLNNWAVTQTGGDNSNTVFNYDGTPAENTTWVQVVKISRPANGTGSCNTAQMTASFVAPPYTLDFYHGGNSLSTKADTNLFNGVPNNFPASCQTSCGWFFFNISFAGGGCATIQLAGRGSVNAFALALEKRFLDLGLTGWKADLLNEGNYTYMGATIIKGAGKNYDIDQVCNAGKGCQQRTDSIHGDFATPIRCTDELYQFKVTYPDSNTIILWSRPRFYAQLSGTVEHTTRCELMKKGSSPCNGDPCDPNIPPQGQILTNGNMACLIKLPNVCGASCPSNCSAGIATERTLTLQFISNPIAITRIGILNPKSFGVNTLIDQGFAGVVVNNGAIYADGFGCGTSECEWCVNGFQLDVS